MSSIGKLIRKLSRARSDSEESGEEISSRDIEQDYKLIWSRIGNGISGSTYACASRESGSKYALKILEDNKRSKTEIRLQRRCQQSENVVPIVDVFRCVGRHPGCSQGSRYLHVVMELQRGGNLFQYIKRNGGVREERAVPLVRHIVSGLKSIHKQGIIHKDLKPENVLLSEEGEEKQLCAKLCDFGFSCEGKSNPIQVEYTPYYVAPEVLCKDTQYNPFPSANEMASYDHRCDVWSLGVVLFCMLIGESPFYSEVNYVPLSHLMYENIQTARYKIPASHTPGISTEAQDLISALLRPNPEDRLSLDKVLSHPWFEKYDIDSTSL